jgi:Protein of unknown function (DUF1588)/Protein of unknown function (DUF1592)/Protein of unknown function (DUF1595)/Protein of unknown function (DUF1587)/Protein of unknown function (DUF1585)
VTPRKTKRIGSLAFALALQMSCTGSLGTSGANGRSSPSSTPSSSGGPAVLPTMEDVAKCGTQTLAQRTLLKRQARRLSVRELKNTGDALLGEAVVDASKLPVDPQVEGYDTDVPSLGFSASYAESLMLVSEDFAAKAIANLGKLVPCQGDVRSDACIKTLIRSFSEKAFRRTVSDAEVQTMSGIYEKARTHGDQDFALKVFFQYIFLSPHFQYRIESGTQVADAPKALRLKGDELANALSYALTAAPPDALLTASARSGALDDVAELKSQAERLVLSDKGKAHFKLAARKWLQLRPVDELAASGVGTLAPELEAQTNAFLDELLAKNGTFKEFYTTRTISAKSKLAEYYGMTAGSNDGEKVGRYGILGHGSVLASNASEGDTMLIFRGLFVNRRLFCVPIGEPPPFPEETEAEKEKNAKLPIREQLRLHQQKGSFCENCHKLIDPAGYALEAFDHTGKFRTKYANGTAVDTAGELVSTDVDGPMDGAKSLADKLGSSYNARSCFAVNMMQFALGRDQSTFDACSQVHMAGAPQHEQGIRDALVNMVTSDWFTHRTK